MGARGLRFNAPVTALLLACALTSASPAAASPAGSGTSPAASPAGSGTSPAASPASGAPTSPDERRPSAPGATGRGASRRQPSRPHARAARLAYLTRPVPASARYLDHGVLGVALAGGVPHGYRLALGLGLFDHLTLGVTARWLPGERAPAWSPVVRLAFWRGRQWEVGASYHRSLYGPPAPAADGEPVFRKDAHWVLGALTVAGWWVSAGFELGLARGREARAVLGDPGERPYVVRNRLGGGLHARIGTRRFGLSARVLWPYLEAEVAFDVRFGLFERRPRGGWRPDRTPGVTYGRAQY